MNRINVYAYPDDDYQGETKLDGWFDVDAAEKFWPMWDGANPPDRGQYLYRTVGGRWVLCHYSKWQGEPNRYEFVGDDAAKDWLIRQYEEKAVAKYFGELEEERGPGRPEVGAAINVRLGDELLAQVDAHAREQGMSRAAVIRVLLSAHLSEI